ncbi:MAG: twin-arginine translocase subunit TatC [Planctomycetes bacterium]|nr:twin-arginine translocase subunit TatC [Planctomycetota bacterium]
MAEATPDELEHTRMTLGGHLEELRRRITRSLVALVLALLAAWAYREEVLTRVMWPWKSSVERINADLVERSEALLVADPTKQREEYFASADPSDRRLRRPVEERLSAFGVGDSFFVSFHVSFYVALFLAGPYVLFELWQFIAAGLYRHEKRLVYLYFPFSVVLFFAGIAFAFFLIVPSGLYFLSTTLPVELVQPQLGIEKYFEFLSRMCLAIGAVFQLPILMVFFASIGLVEPKSYGRWRKHFIVVALLVAAIITPSPDAITQLLTTAPMLMLYEIGILLSRWRGKPRRLPDGGGA